jgi:integrase/recombinase XerD
MVYFKVLLNDKRQKADNIYPIVVRVTFNRNNTTFNTGIRVKNNLWDEPSAKVKHQHPNAQAYNKTIADFHSKIQDISYKLINSDKFNFETLKEHLTDNIKPTVIPAVITFKGFAEKLINEMFAVNETGNAIIYQTALNRLMSWVNNRNLTFIELDYTLLEAFRRQLIKDGMRPNSVSNYFRTLRAIYNKAIKAKLVDRSNYPFLDIQVKTEKTAKRAITLEDLRKILHGALKLESPAWHSRNYFLLSFALRGASFTDLAYLKQENIEKGMLIYKRRKTGTKLCISVTSEIEKLLTHYRGIPSVYLLPILQDNIIEGSRTAKKVIAQWIKTTNKYLGRIASNLNIDDEITTYVSRHTWATAAKKLGFSNELIAECMGHEYGNKITNIYLDNFGQDMIDTVNSTVLSNLKTCQLQVKTHCKYVSVTGSTFRKNQNAMLSLRPSLVL